MARIIVQDELRAAVRLSSFIKGGDEGCVEGVKYIVRLGSRILKASYGRPVDAAKLGEIEKKDLYLDPGELAFALTEERLALGKNIMAVLSSERKITQSGVVAIGEQWIDPLYEGQLVVGFYNFSLSRFPLTPGKKVLAATFFELEGGERGDFSSPGPPVDDFPDELVHLVQGYQPLWVPFLKEALQSMRTEVETLRTAIVSREEWYKRIEQAQDRHDTQIAELIKAHASEQEARKSGQDRVIATLSRLEQTLAWLKGAAWIGSVLLGIISAVIIGWVLRALKLA